MTVYSIAKEGGAYQKVVQKLQGDKQLHVGSM